MMRSGPIVAATMAVLLIAVLGLGPVLAVNPASAQLVPDREDTASPAVSSPGLDAPAPPGADNTVTRIALLANGTARWEIQIRTRLATAEDEEAHEEFRASFDEQQYVEQFSRNITRTVDAAEAATGRSMTVESFDASTSIQPTPRRWGVLTYSFRWDGFAAQDGGTFRMGDVFEGGFYLAENDTLVVEAPEGTEITSVDPPAEQHDRTATWTGEQVFVDGRPRIVAEPVDRSGSGPPIVLGIVALLLVVGAVIVVRRRGTATEDVTPAADTTASSATSEPTPEPDGTPSTDGATRDSRSRETTEQTTEPSTPNSVTDDQGRVLSDTERVEQLLRDAAGQLHQSDIRDELDWSSSKTSRVLSKMVDAGTIRKVKIGRQNVIELEEGEGS
jgi:hypothetical protein